MTQDELMEYFGFDESDLQANRAGKLSAKQAARLSGGDASSRRRFLVVGLVLAGVAIVPTSILWLTGEIGAVGWYSLLWVIPSGLLALVLVRAGLRRTTHSLKKAQGKVEIYHELHVGDTQFGVGEELARRMKEDTGQTYAVYYYWGSDTVETDLIDSHIMSIEKAPG